MFSARNAHVQPEAQNPFAVPRSISRDKDGLSTGGPSFAGRRRKIQFSTQVADEP